MDISAPTEFTSHRAKIARRTGLLPETERDLAFRARSGDRRAARFLAEGYLSLVHRIALDYRRWGVPHEDLVQEGNIGLLRAVEGFEPERGVRLGVYAACFIRAKVRDYAERHRRIVKLGSSHGERRAVRILRRTDERRPEVLAGMTGLTEVRVVELLGAVHGRDISLSPGEDDGSAMERLADGGSSPEELMCVADERDRLQFALGEVLAGLTPRELDIVHRRFMAEDPETLQELGLRFGVSKERVRQIEERLKARMRSRIEGMAVECA